MRPRKYVIVSYILCNKEYIIHTSSKITKTFIKYLSLLKLVNGDKFSIISFKLYSEMKFSVLNTVYFFNFIIIVCNT